MADAQEGGPEVQAAALASLKAYGDPPRLSDDEQWYFTALAELHFDRPIAQMAKVQIPIPMAAIITYADYVGLKGAERDLFVRIIRMLDFIDCGAFNQKSSDSAK